MGETMRTFPAAIYPRSARDKLVVFPISYSPYHLTHSQSTFSYHKTDVNWVLFSIMLPAGTEGSILPQENRSPLAIMRQILICPRPFDGAHQNGHISSPRMPFFINLFWRLFLFYCGEDSFRAKTLRVKFPFHRKR